MLFYGTAIKMCYHSYLVSYKLREKWLMNYWEGDLDDFLKLDIRGLYLRHAGFEEASGSVDTSAHFSQRNNSEWRKKS